MPARCSALTMSRNSSTDAERVLPRAVGRVRRKERDRLVAPVVDHARWAGLGVELEDRQQLDGRDAQVLQVGNLLDQPGIGAALVRRTPELGWRVKPRTCIS